MGVPRGRCWRRGFASAGLGRVRRAGGVRGDGGSGAMIFSMWAHKGGQVQKMVDQAEIHRKVVSGDVEESMGAVEQLRRNFAVLPDKKQAWNDLIRLAQDGNSNIRWDVIDALDSTFQHVLDKEGAWTDLVWLMGGKGSGVRQYAGCVLGSVFLHVPDMKGAWRDLHRLTADENSNVRQGAADALGSAFQHIPEKDEAWEDLHQLIQDEDWIVRMCAAGAIGYAFQYIPEKDAAWKDIHKLTEDEDGILRRGAAGAIGSAFLHILKKDEAWNDLHKLTADEDRDARFGAADALSHAFSHIPDKKQAWADLIHLTEDEASDTRLLAAGALGSAFQHVPDKKQAWKDLIQLTEDEDCNVRASANHSRGRVSIFKATEAENEERFREEMKNALEFFEKSSNEATYLHTPSRFCLPFYRSFYTILFGKVGAKSEVRRYLAEAKSASKGSKNKETLLEAVENLANALSEAHKVTDFDSMKTELNACRRYCDRAADLIGDAAEGAPGAARILRRGLPIIGERIRDIQEKAEALCKETRGTGTPYEPLGTEVNKWARDLSDRGYLRDEKDVPRIRDLLGKLCNLILEDERDYPCKIVEEIREEREPEDNLSDVVTALSYLVPSIKSQLQNAAQTTTDRTGSDEHPSQKTGRGTTVIASDSTVVVTETKSGDVTVNTAVTKESQPDKQPDRSSKRTVIKISADIAVHVLVYTVLHHFAEDLMPVIAPILVLSALIILLVIILTRNRDRSSLF